MCVVALSVCVTVCYVLCVCVWLRVRFLCDVWSLCLFKVCVLFVRPCVMLYGLCVLCLFCLCVCFAIEYVLCL